MFHIFPGKFMNITNLLTIKLSLVEPDITLRDSWLEMEPLIGTLMFHQVSHQLPITSILFQRRHMMITINSAAKFSSMISSQDSDLIKLNVLNFGTMMSWEACVT